MHLAATIANDAYLQSTLQKVDGTVGVKGYQRDVFKEASRFGEYSCGRRQGEC